MLAPGERAAARRAPCSRPRYHGVASNPSVKTVSSGPDAAGTSVATSYEAGVPSCATCNVAVPATGAELETTEYEYIVPQSSVPPVGAVHVTEPFAFDAVHALAPSTVPLRKVAAPIVPPAGMERLSKPMLLTTRGSGPWPVPCPCVTARAKSKFMTA